MTTKEKKPTPRLVLYVREWARRQHDTDSTAYELCVLMVQEGHDHPSNISRSSQEYVYPGIGVFEDLQFHCYISWYKGEFNAASWETRYGGYITMDRVDEAEQKVQGLKRAAKIRQSFQIQPATFGQYAVLMAAGFGVKECCRERESRGGTFYSDSRWQFCPIQYAQGWIDEEIEKLRKQHTEVAA